MWAHLCDHDAAAAEGHAGQGAGQGGGGGRGGGGGGGESSPDGCGCRRGESSVPEPRCSGATSIGWAQLQPGYPRVVTSRRARSRGHHTRVGGARPRRALRVVEGTAPRRDVDFSRWCSSTSRGQVMGHVQRLNASARHLSPNTSGHGQNEAPPPGQHSSSSACASKQRRYYYSAQRSAVLIAEVFSWLVIANKVA